MKIWIAHEEGRAPLGPLPDGVEVEIYEGGEYPSDPVEVEFWVPPFTGAESHQALADMPRLKAVQLLSAGVETWVGHLPEGVAL